MGSLEESSVVFDFVLFSLANLLLDGSEISGGSLGVGLAGLLVLPDLLADFVLLQLSQNGGIRVELLHFVVVVERVLLLSWVEDLVGLLGSENSLDGVGVDDSGDVAVGNDLSAEDVVLACGAGSVLGAELGAELVEGGLGVKNETANLSAWGQMTDVETVDVKGADAWDVLEGSFEALRFVANNNKRTATEFVASVAVLSLSGSDLSGVDDSLNIFVGAEALQHGDGVLGLGDLANAVVDDEGELGNLQDAVTSGEDEGGHGGGSDS